MIIGFVFGNGNLPNVLLENTQYSVCAIIGDIPQNIAKAAEYKQFKTTQIPEIIDFFKENGVTYVCLAGFIQKPKISMEMFNFRLAPLLFKILTLPTKGDNALLTTILSYIRSKGFKIIGASDVMPSLLVKAGTLTNKNTTSFQEREIQTAHSFLHDISKYDISQSCIVQNNTIIAIEGIEGTQNMIKRTSQYAKDAILVKLPKVGQSLKVDMPTIGIETILACANSGICGIVIKAEQTIVLDQDLVIQKANENNMFIVSIV